MKFYEAFEIVSRAAEWRNEGNDDAPDGLEEAERIYESARPHAVGTVQIVNTTPHPINFWLNGLNVVVPTSGIVINAKPEEREIENRDGMTFVETVFIGTDEGRADIAAIKRAWPVRELVIVGSIIAAQAYPGDVAAMVPAPGFERVPPAEKRMRADKFTIYPGSAKNIECPRCGAPMLSNDRECAACGTTWDVLETMMSSPPKVSRDLVNEFDAIYGKICRSVANGREFYGFPSDREIQQFKDKLVRANMPEPDMQEENKRHYTFSSCPACGTVNSLTMPVCAGCGLPLTD